MIVETFTVGPLQENSYFVVDEATGAAALVDPGDEGGRLVRAIRESGARLEAIWLTHAHVDHVGAVAAVKRAFDVPVYLHPLDLPLYRVSDRQAAMFGLAFEAPPEPERALADGETVRVGSLTFDVMHAPGHAPGLCVIHGHGSAFVGDLIFAGSIGRTDLPLADPAAMAASLEKACTLPGATVLYPGHGPPTTVDAERRSNPFLSGVARVLRR